MTMERSQELYQHPSSSDKSIEGGSGEVTLYQVACHCHLLSFGSQTTGDRGQETSHCSENLVFYKKKSQEIK